MTSSSDRPAGQPVTVDELAALVLGLDPTAPARLLEQHVPDEHGKCRGCALVHGGSTRGATPWPCTLHAIADRARAAANRAGQ